MTNISAVKGTRDFYPEEMSIRRWMLELIQRVSERFGYQEYDGPFLETLELYAAKSGEELVKEQSFVFPDRGGDMIALRPELTPSLARMVAARRGSLFTPLRWWSFGPFWRYERPQKGRTREFFQWNLDLLGVESPQADAEVAAVAAEFFRAAGLGPDQIRILVNDRRLAERQLQEIGIEPSPETFRLIDRKERQSDEVWRSTAMDRGLTQQQLEALETLLADRRASVASSELQQFFDAGSRLGVDEYLGYDPSVIRGLDYYSGIVFEARDRDGEFRAVLGGGRYDNLVSDVGGEPLPATGFAMGDVVVKLVLGKFGRLPELVPSPSQILVTTFDEQLVGDSLELTTELRGSGLRTEWYPTPDRLAKQLKYADRRGIPLVAILGPAELEAGTVTLKWMSSGDQEQRERSALAGLVDELPSHALA